MNKHILDLTNQKIGRLTVLSLSDQRTPSGKIMWLDRWIEGNPVEIPEGMSDMEVETR